MCGGCQFKLLTSSARAQPACPPLHTHTHTILSGRLMVVSGAPQMTPSWTMRQQGLPLQGQVMGNQEPAPYCVEEITGQR